MATEELFVKIDDPLTVRLSLLEESKKIVHALQTYHKLISLREKKLDLILDLKDQIKELVLLFSKLDASFPDHSLREVVKQELMKPKVNKPQQSTKSNKKASKTSTTTAKPKEKYVESEMDKLNRTLQQIEDKLNAIR